MSEPRIDILGVGSACVDDLLIVECFPERNEKIDVLEAVRLGGGLTGSALVAAARLGCQCHLVHRLGTDEISCFIRDSLTREGITIHEQAPIGGFRPYHSVIIVEKRTGERSILCKPAVNILPEITGRETALLNRARCLYVDSIFASRTAGLAAKAREMGLPVVGDFESETAGAAELMPLVDHLIVPLQFGLTLTGAASPEEAVSRLAGQSGRSLACVTDSERGCWYAEGDAPSGVRHCPSFTVERIVDTTGCGDVFHGAYAACLVQGFPVAERVRRAAATAALKAGKLGAQQGAPTRSELEAFLSGKSA